MWWRFLRNRRLILRLHRPTIFRALTYWAHRAVILAIVWFSCSHISFLLYSHKFVQELMQTCIKISWAWVKGISIAIVQCYGICQYMKKVLKCLRCTIIYNFKIRSLPLSTKRMAKLSIRAVSSILFVLANATLQTHYQQISHLTTGE